MKVLSVILLAVLVLRMGSCNHYCSSSAETVARIVLSKLKCNALIYCLTDLVFQSQQPNNRGFTRGFTTLIREYIGL